MFEGLENHSPEILIFGLDINTVNLIASHSDSRVDSVADSENEWLHSNDTNSSGFQPLLRQDTICSVMNHSCH